MMIEVSHIPGRVALGHSLWGRCPFSRLVSFGLPPAFCRAASCPLCCAHACGLTLGQRQLGSTGAQEGDGRPSVPKAESEVRRGPRL